MRASCSRVHARQPQVDERDIVGSASRGRLREEIDRLLGRLGDPALISQLLICARRMPLLTALGVDDQCANARQPPDQRRRAFARRRLLARSWR